MIYDAILCDLDGVILDAYDLWDGVVSDLLLAYGVVYDDGIKAQLWQLSMEEAEAYLLSLLGSACSREVLRTRQMLALERAYAKVGLIDGARELLQGLAERGLPVVAVTSNHLNLARLGLASNHLLPFFREVYSSQELGFPDKNRAFLTQVCQKEVMVPNRLLLIEDSPHNLLEAQSLGIQGVFLNHSLYPWIGLEGVYRIDRLGAVLDLLDKESTMIRQRCYAKGQYFVEAIYQDAFIQGLIAGDLSPDAVRHYLRADSIYLGKFADIYAILLSRVSAREDKAFFLSQIDFILNQEVLAHHLLADYVGESYEAIVADAAWYPQADHYIKHMYYQLQQGSPAYVLSAMLPCPWIYREVARLVLNRHELGEDNPFRGWFEFYAGDAMDHCCEVYERLVAQFTQEATVAEERELTRCFLESCQHERQFFQMAVDGSDWPREVRDV